MQTFPLECRKVVKAELAQVSQLEDATFPPPVYPIFFFRQAFDLWPELFWVASDGSQLKAYLVAAPSADNAKALSLLSLAVSPLSQGQGVGKALLKQFLQSLPCDHSVWLTVDPSNQAAIKLYQQFDFHVVREEANYYGEGYHRLVMQREATA